MEKMEKKDLRAFVRAKKRAMTPAQVEAASARLAEKLFRHPAYQAAKSLYGYLSYNQEVRTAAILRRAQQDGKRVAVPKVYGEEMKFLWLDDLNRTMPGAYNIPEPIGDEPEADDETALILMPGPMEDAVTQLLMYCPFAAAGFALIMAFMRVV